jgi:glucose-6-phosphate 1-dehydrogenase
MTKRKDDCAYPSNRADSVRRGGWHSQAEWRIITPIEEAWAQLPAPAFPNYAAGSEGPTSWHELLKIRGNTADWAIGYGR